MTPEQVNEFRRLQAKEQKSKEQSKKWYAGHKAQVRMYDQKYNAETKAARAFYKKFYGVIISKDMVGKKLA